MREFGEGKIKIDYDDEHDMLFITVGKPREAVTWDIGQRIHMRTDPDTCEIVGVTITAFAKGFLQSIIGGFEG